MIIIHVVSCFAQLVMLMLDVSLCLQPQVGGVMFSVVFLCPLTWDTSRS